MTFQRVLLFATIVLFCAAGIVGMGWLNQNPDLAVVVALIAFAFAADRARAL